MRFPPFEGHFPGDPIVPGAALLRAVERASGRTFTRLERVRFLGVVRPDEEVDIELTDEGERVRFRMKRGGEDVLRGSAITGVVEAPAVLRLVPTLARPIWGGDTLAGAWGKDPAPGARIGETWEVWRENRTADGRRLADVLDFPLLVKLLDVRETLSVQVHPDDAAARAAGHPHGKHEAWVVLHAEPGAKVAVGLTRTLPVEELRERALSGAIEADLAWREVKVGDVIDVPPGTIHAIGGGVLLYEVQQPCDLTWRLYDWGRGRPLHLEEALGVVIRGPAPEPVRSWEEGIVTPHFRIDRVVLPARRTSGAWAALTLVEGTAEVGGVRLGRGETALVPPGEWEIGGEGVALVAALP